MVKMRKQQRSREWNEIVGKRRREEMETREGRRRRKILERGSDRLALITGEIDSLSSSSSSYEPHHLKTASLPPSLLYQDPALRSTRLHGVASEKNFPRTELTRSETTDGSIRGARIHACRKLGPQARKRETPVDSTTTPTALNENKAQPPLPPSLHETLKSAVGEPSPGGEAPQRLKVFTANKICYSISASGNIRLVSAISIALLVVLSHIRTPLIRSNLITSTITTNPVYLVLLTDVTILVARFLLWKQVVSDKEKEKTGRSEGACSWAQGLSATFVLYKVIAAAFMDCCVYLVVVICGLSLLQIWL